MTTTSTKDARPVSQWWSINQQATFTLYIYAYTYIYVDIRGLRSAGNTGNWITDTATVDYASLIWIYWFLIFV